jgi:hypothetical protein
MTGLMNVDQLVDGEFSAIYVTKTFWGFHGSEDCVGVIAGLGLLHNAIATTIVKHTGLV